MIEMSVDGFDELEKLLKDISTGKPLIMGMDRGAFYIRGKVSAYPPKSGKGPSRESIYGQAFVSDKQRRYFFAALQSGEIEVPYRRGLSPGSERHKASWTITKKRKGLTQIIGSDTSYGIHLQDPDEQTAYAKAIGWDTTDEVSERETPEVLRIVDNTIQMAIRRLDTRD